MTQDSIRKNSLRAVVFLLSLACCISCAPQRQNDSLAVRYVEKKTPRPESAFIAPDTMPELCSSSIQSHTIGNKLYWVKKEASLTKQMGLASWYGNPFHGRRTANGEIFNMYELSAAHKKMPMASLALVTNLKNGKAVVVRVNDRGPFYKQRIIDLSYSAAHKINMVEDGVVPVEVRLIGMPFKEEAAISYFSWSATVR